jgi:hypothetical protein
MMRLQNIADSQVNRPDYLRRQLAQITAIKESQDDPPRFWSNAYRFAVDFGQTWPPVRGKPWTPDAFFFRAFRAVHAASFNEPTPFEDEYFARYEALREKYGWPEEDEEGEMWSPEDNIPADELPADYVAFSEWAEGRFEPEETANLRRVFVRSGVEDILDLRERNPEEFHRRMKAGEEFNAWAGEDEKAADESE